MKMVNKFLMIVFLSASLVATSCGGGEKTAEGAEAKTEESATAEAATSVVGTWKLADVNVDMESLPAPMKEQLEKDPTIKTKMEEGLKAMIAEGMGFEFTDGGVAKLNSKGKVEEAKYEYKDKVLTITDKKGPKSMNVSELTSKTMAFTMEEGGMKMVMKFDKQ